MLCGVRVGCVNRRFCAFLFPEKLFWGENEEKMRFFQKKSGKCFVVKKKALPLHSLYDSNGAQIDVASLAQLARARDL